MNLKNLLTTLLMLFAFTVMVSTATFAQTFSTVYVDVTNGSNAYTGQNPTNNPAGTGPKATIAGGLGVLNNNGTMVVMAGTYLGVDNASGNVDINLTSYPALTGGLTIELRRLNGNDNINLTAGSFIFNIPGGTLNITATNGTEKINQTNTSVTLTAGNVSFANSAFWVIPNNSTINIAGTAGFSNAAPTKGANLSLNYTGDGSFTAGAESNYGSYGTGTITVGKTAGTTVTFPNAITSVAAINVTASGSNAIFSGNVSVSAGLGDVTNAGAGTLTFNGNLALGVTDGNVDANIAGIENASTGSIAVNGSVTWTATNTADRDFGAEYAISNTGTGSITLGAINLVAGNGTAPRNFLIEARNASTGVLTLGAVTAASSGTQNNYGILRLTGAAAAGTINIGGGSYRDFVTVNATHTLNVNGATTVLGVLTNAGTIALGSNNLTLSGDANINHLTNTGTVTGSGKVIAAAPTGRTHTFNGGLFSNVEVNGAGTVNFTNAAFTATTLDLTAGTVGININGTVSTINVTGATATLAATRVLTVNGLFSQTGGSFILAAGATTTLDVKGNLNRTDGVFTAGGAGNTLVSFTGSGAQSINGGALFQTENLTFTNAGGTITVGNSIRSSGTVTISTATNVDFGTTNLILNGTANGMINNGTYTATAGSGGGVILGGTNTVVGGVTGNGFSLQGTGTYSYVTVDVGNTLGAAIATTGNTVANPTVITTGAAHGLATGDVVLYPGTASIPAGYYAITVLTGTTFSIPVNAAANDGATAGVQQINAAKVTTTVTGVKFNGILSLRSGALSIATPAVDFGPTGSSASIVRYPETSPGIFPISGSTFNVASVAYDLTYSGAITANRAVGAELTSTPANVRTWTVNTTGAFNNDLPITGLNFGGTLYIENGATVRIPTGGAGDLFTLSGAGKAHTIRGAFDVVDANDALVISGAGSSLTGSTVLAHAATVDNIRLNSTGLTVSNVQAFSGTVTAGAGSTVSFGMGAAAAEQAIAGLVTLGGTTFTLTTPIIANAGVSHTAGELAFGANNLSIGGGNFVQSAGTQTSTGGYLVYTVDGGLTLSSAIPYLRVNNVDVTLGSAITVSQNLDITGAGTPSIITAGAANDITIPVAMTTVGGAVVTGLGDLVLTGGQVTASGDVNISNITLNSAGTAVLASNNGTARTFTVSTALTLTAGTLSIGANSVDLTGAGNALVRTNGNISTGEGYLIFGGGAAQTPQQGTGFSVGNLAVNNAAGVTFLGGATNDFTVTNNLALVAGALSSTTAGKLHIGNLATITRVADASTLAEVPTFDGDVNLVYAQFDGADDTDGTMGNEAPTAASNKLNNLEIDVEVAGVGAEVLSTNAARSFKGTLTLTSGHLGNAGGALTAASGATIDVAGGTVDFNPVVTNYNLTYSDGSVTTTNTEFRTGAGISVDTLTINSTGTVTLHAARTVKKFVLSAGTFSNGGFNLTVTGAIDLAGGTYAGTGSLILGGTTAQTFKVPAAGLTLFGDLTINNPAGVTLQGGNLTMGSGKVVAFTNGIFNTGDFALTLDHSVSSSGYTRTVAAPNQSHVVGKVTHAIAAGSGMAGTNGRYEFPVGTATDYRPFAVAFTPTYVAGNPTTLTVQHVDSSAGGTPQVSGVSGYPNYYWLVKTSPSPFGVNQLFDIELYGTDIAFNDALRIIKRQDGNAEANPWSLQGVASNYANFRVVNGTDTTSVVRTTSSIGGIVNEGTRFTIGLPGEATNFAISGKVTYAGKSTAPVSGVIVTLNSTPAKVDTTDATGSYSFSNVANGTYSITATTAKAWGGVNATDALNVLKYTVGQISISDALILSAANVNNDANINGTDALDILKRSAGLITSFAKGNWVFDSKTVNVNGTVLANQDIRAIAVGDVDTSYVPSVAKVNNTVAYSVDGNVQVSSKEAFEIPVKVASNVSVNAMNLSFTYSSELGEFAGVSSKGNVVVFESNGRINIAFASLEAMDLKANEAIVTLKFKPRADFKAGKEFSVELDNAASLVADKDGQEISVALKGANATAYVPSAFALKQNYPNPFNPSTTISYELPVNGNVTLSVYNSIGELVATLVDGVQEAGVYKINWNASNLSSGVYFYSIKVNGEKSFSKTSKMLLMK